jgi:hypothetical protein
MSSPFVVDYGKSFSFALPPSEIWEELERPDQLTSRWRWIEVLHVDPQLKRGAELSCVIKPPLPYRMSLDVMVAEVSNCKQIVVEINGDLQGRAELTLEPTLDGSMVGVSWRLEMMQRQMRAVARYAYPLLRWGHDRVVEAAVRNFRRDIEPRQNE